MNKNIIEILSEKIRQRPDSPIFLALAGELKKQDRLDEAINTLLDGLKLNPDYIPARLTLAQLYKENHMDSEYVKELEKIIQKDHDNIQAKKMLHQHYIDKGISREKEEVLHKKTDDNQIETSFSTNTIRQPNYDEKNQFNKQDTPVDFSDEITQIDKLSAEQRYKEALIICDTILSHNPSNRKVLQKKEELKFLIKLMNKPKESAIKRLRNFKIALIKLYFRARLEA